MAVLRGRSDKGFCKHEGEVLMDDNIRILIKGFQNMSRPPPLFHHSKTPSSILEPGISVKSSQKFKISGLNSKKSNTIFDTKMHRIHNCEPQVLLL